MKQFNFLPLTAALAICVFATPLFAKEQELPEVTEEGLHRIHDSEMALVYAEPEADLSIYDQVLLVEAYVAFKKDWARKQRSKSADPLSVNSRDMENIKTQLAEEFDEVFRTQLEGAGYKVTDTTGESVLLVRPAIINLDVNAPDTPRAGRGHSYTSSAGEMTLYLELFDSVTGDLIAKALDRRVDNAYNGFYTWTNSVTNKAAAQRILKGWADILVNALDEAHGK